MQVDDEDDHKRAKVIDPGQAKEWRGRHLCQDANCFFSNRVRLSASLFRIKCREQRILVQDIEFSEASLGE
jgi:hypothetical protein